MSQEEITAEDVRFEDILKMDGINIQSFHQQEPLDLFPNAEYHPDFFNQNLVNPNRVLKQFLNDPQSNIRIFYYQILRLSFQIPSESGYNHACLQNLKKIIFHPEFQIMFTPDTQSERQIYNDFQFKKLFAEFISLLISASESQPPSIEQAINQFPIIDIVMTHIIRSLLVSLNIKVAFDQKIPTDQLFKQLSSILQLSLTSYGNCWKFQESDMFCYEESQNEIYLAYIVQDIYEDGDQNLEPVESQNDQQRSSYEPPSITINTAQQQYQNNNSYSNDKSQEFLKPQPVIMTNTYNNNDNIRSVQSQIVTQKQNIYGIQPIKPVSIVSQSPKYTQPKRSPYQPPVYRTQQQSNQIQSQQQTSSRVKQSPYQPPFYQQSYKKTYQETVALKPSSPYQPPSYQPPSYQPPSYQQPKRNQQPFESRFQKQQHKPVNSSQYKQAYNTPSYQPTYKVAQSSYKPQSISLTSTNIVQSVKINTTNHNSNELSSLDRNIEQTLSRINNELNSINNFEQNTKDIFQQKNQSNYKLFQPQISKYQPPKFQIFQSQNYQPQNFKPQSYQSQRYESTYKQPIQSSRYQTQRYHTQGSQRNYETSSYKYDRNNFSNKQYKRYEVPTQLMALNTSDSVFSKPFTSFNYERKDYSQDFTPSDILGKLRSTNKDNISKIKQEFRNIKIDSIPPQGTTGRAVSNIELRNYSSSYNSYSPQIRPSSTNLAAGYVYNNTYTRTNNSFY